ncbi:MAG: hypothetical protein ACLUPV_04055 [Bilophila wadsworthia]
MGPDLGNNAEFEETDEARWQELRDHGAAELACRFGRWDIPGRPKVILVGYRSAQSGSFCFPVEPLRHRFHFRRVGLCGARHVQYCAAR